MRYGSVCSGIEAATMAWHPLGWEPAFFSEIEAYPCAVLAHHYPHVPNHGDMTKFEEWPDHAIDLLVGGTPCQSFSVAGLRQGLADPRGNLMLTYLAIARRYQPRWLVWENVPGVLSSNGGRDFGTFVRGLEECGYHAAWRVLDAQYVRVDGFPYAVPQRRRRVFVVGYLGDWRRAAAVLLEREGLRGDSAPSRSAGEGVAPTISSRPTGGGGLGTDFDLDGGLVHAPEIARCVATREGSSQDYETTTMVAVSVTGEVAHTLKAEGADASEDGTGRGTPIVAFDARQSDVLVHGDKTGPLDCGFPGPAICFTAKDYGGDAQVNLSPTLRAGGHSGSHANAGVMPAITVAIRGREGGATAELGGEVATALRASQGGGDEPHVLAFDTYNQTTAETTHTIRAGAGMEGIPAIVTSAVRRLTPVECERLQGFPDNFTAVPHRGKPAADGPRYKALGNSMAVNVMRWIGYRIDRVESILQSMEEAA